MEMHVRALFTHDGRSRLLRVNEPGGSEAPAPRLFLGLTRDGALRRFSPNVPDALAEELESLCADEPACAESCGGAPRHAAEYVRLLESHAPVRALEAGPAFHFTEFDEPSRPLLSITEANEELLRGGFEDLMDEPPTWQPFVALVEDGRAVSVCRSARITREAHEAGVETLPEFRGKGYARDVVAGWARMVRAAGATPLYSTSWENQASRALAKKLRLEFYGADFHVT
jgi:RimJ/RimL family protein N-acetyltransferase